MTEKETKKLTTVEDISLNGGNAALSQPVRRNRCNHIVVVDTIDLHGMTREIAIRNLTSFLSESKRAHGKSSEVLWVRVITGAGKHSPHGPVLRVAVQDLLVRREMTFRLNPEDTGRGSFDVLVNSGFELYAEDPGRKKDTKVILMKPEDATEGGIRTNTADFNIERSTQLNVRRRFGSLPTLTSISEVNDNLGSEYSPLPREVAADDDIIARVSRMSVQEAVENKNHTRCLDQEQLEESLAKSMETVDEEEKMLIKALELSTMENQNPIDDGDLETAIRESIASVHTNSILCHESNYEDEIKLAIEMSIEHERALSLDQTEEIALAIRISQQDITHRRHNPHHETHQDARPPLSNIVDISGLGLSESEILRLQEHGFIPM